MIAELLLIATGMATLFNTYLSVNELHKYINYKPFNCPNCLAWWTTLILGYILTSNIILTIAAAGISFYLPILIKKINKL
jgi:hypothetical protein